jgi:hypothetical protein
VAALRDAGKIDALELQVERLEKVAREAALTG